VYVIQSNEIKHLHHWNAGRNRTYWLTSGSVCTECHCCLQAVVTYHIFLFYFNRQIRKEDIQKAISNLSIIGITKHIYIYRNNTWALPSFHKKRCNIYIYTTVTALLPFGDSSEFFSAAFIRTGIDFDAGLRKIDSQVVASIL
jgi:hypothetical protein